MHWLFWFFLIAGASLIIIPTFVMVDLDGVGIYWLLGGIFMVLAMIYLIVPAHRMRMVGAHGH
ncbi:MAG: hypothetical protein ACYC7E_10380 [Armatimonadota bacterium]